MERMWEDILLQAGLILVTIFMFLLMHNIPQKFFRKLLSLRGKADLQAKRHFILGAQLLNKARSSKSSSSSSSKESSGSSSVRTLAKSAESEADKAIALNPKDAASHILKALALELQGFRSSALDSLDVALSPLAVKSLSDEERADALFKRAELRMALNRRGKVDSVVEDLVESVRLKKNDNYKAFCLLGECYEKKGLISEAKKAYEDALSVEPSCNAARERLDRLGS